MVVLKSLQFMCSRQAGLQCLLLQLGQLLPSFLCLSSQLILLQLALLLQALAFSLHPQKHYLDSRSRVATVDMLRLCTL